MDHAIERLYRFLGRSLVFRSRVLLGALVVPLALTATAPLWKIRLEAPQYPQGLELRIYAHTVDGDLREVNTLNHYIGMRRIDRAELSDLDWIPFALGALGLLTLRVASIGDLRSLVDLSALFAYFSAFSLVRFGYRLWVFGHNLDPKAPFHVEPFTPALLGTRQIANFTTTALPGAGTLWIGVFALGLALVVVWNFREFRR
jgi:hypothetical protein